MPLPVDIKELILRYVPFPDLLVGVDAYPHILKRGSFWKIRLAEEYNIHVHAIEAQTRYYAEYVRKLREEGEFFSLGMLPLQMEEFYREIHATSWDDENEFLTGVYVRDEKEYEYYASIYMRKYSHDTNFLRACLHKQNYTDAARLLKDVISANNYSVRSDLIYTKEMIDSIIHLCAYTPVQVFHKLAYHTRRNPAQLRLLAYFLEKYDKRICSQVLTKTLRSLRKRYREEFNKYNSPHNAAYTRTICTMIEKYL